MTKASAAQQTFITNLIDGFPTEADARECLKFELSPLGITEWAEEETVEKFIQRLTKGGASEIINLLKAAAPRRKPQARPAGSKNVKSKPASANQLRYLRSLISQSGGMLETGQKVSIPTNCTSKEASELISLLTEEGI